MSIHDEQAAYLAQHGKYEQRPLQNGIAIDVYQGPQGHGYIVREEKNGQVKQTDYGPEGRSHDWRNQDA